MMADEQRRMYEMYLEMINTFGVDYPVEIGSDYIKWNSGKLEQWGNVGLTSSAASAVKSASITFPEAFKDTNYNFTFSLTRNATLVDRCGECDSGGNSARTTVETQIIANLISSSAYSVYCNWRAIGTWK